MYLLSEVSAEPPTVYRIVSPAHTGKSMLHEKNKICQSIQMQMDGTQTPAGSFVGSRLRVFFVLYVFLMNCSPHLGQRILILPLPRGTRTTCRQRGQVK